MPRPRSLHSLGACSAASSSCAISRPRFASRREHPVLQFATLAGEFISTAGVIFGGTAQRSNGVASRPQGLDQRNRGRAFAVGRRNLSAVTKQREKANGCRSRAAQAALEEARRRHQAAHLSQSNSAAQILLLNHQLRAAEEKLRQVQSERTTLEQQTTIADERIAQLEEELAALTDVGRRAADAESDRVRRERAGAPARGGNGRVTRRACDSRSRPKRSATKICSVSGSRWRRAPPNSEN